MLLDLKRSNPNPDPNPNPNPNQVMLLDLKRSNQINIALAKFRKQGTNVGEEVVAALRKLDDKFIKLEDIPRMRDLVPTALTPTPTPTPTLTLTLPLTLTFPPYP